MSLNQRASFYSWTSQRKWNCLGEEMFWKCLGEAKRSFLAQIIRESVFCSSSLGFPGGASGQEPACQCTRYNEIWVQFLGREDPPEEVMAIHSSILAWRNPWTEEPGWLQSTGSHRVGHDWSDLAYMHCVTNADNSNMSFLPATVMELELAHQSGVKGEYPCLILWGEYKSVVSGLQQSFLIIFIYQLNLYSFPFSLPQNLLMTCPSQCLELRPLQPWGNCLASLICCFSSTTDVPKKHSHISMPLLLWTLLPILSSSPCWRLTFLLRPTSKVSFPRELASSLVGHPDGVADALSVTFPHSLS